MKAGKIAVSLGVVVSAALAAGVFWYAWMAVFLLTRDLRGPVTNAAWWLAAPPVTAAGFAIGATLAGRALGRAPQRLGRVYVWPLIGCSIGAAAVFAFGPMLIVFGMFVLGTLSVIAREVVKSRGRGVGDLERS